jgi:hypothetical protein
MVGASHLSRMISATQLSEQLGGQLSPHCLRKLARQGRISGATRIGNKILFDSRTAGWMIEPLDLMPAPRVAPTALMPKEGTDLNGTAQPT